MAVNHSGIGLSLDDLVRIVRREAVATIQNASIGRAGLRVYDGGWILVEGGGLSVTGTQSVSGALNISGTLTGSGTLNWTGPWALRGNGQIPGDVGISGSLTTQGAVSVVGPISATGPATFLSTMQILGAATLGSTLNVVGGQIQAGNMAIHGGNGGTIVSSGTLNLGGVKIGLGAPLTTALQFQAIGITATTLDVAGAKNFKIPHPTKPDTWLRHGSTESPVSGVEYWGDETLPESGELTVTLPEYFETLTKPDERTVLVTGRGFVADWGDINEGHFTVTGKPGGRFSWLVKAVRADEHGGKFELEEPVYGPQREGAQ